MGQGRKLGFWETGMVLLHDQAHGEGILFSSARIQGKIDKALLRESLFLMFQKHPLLRATISRAEDASLFELNADFDAIPIRFIQREGDQHWLRVGEEELSTLFPSDQYLWRAMLISSDDRNELILSFHHAIIDGFCCVNFVDQLLRLYAELDMQTFFQLESLLLKDSIEHLLAFHPSNQTIEEEVGKIFKPGLTSLNYQTFAPLGKRTIKNRIAELPREQLKKIKEKCRAHHVNVNSLLYAALLLAMQQAKGETLDTLVFTPVNLRNFCASDIDDEAIGVFVSYVGDQTGPIDSNTNLWELAKRYETSLGLRIPKAGFLPADFTQEQLKSLCPYFRVEALPEKRAFTYACRVTNKGLFDFPEIYGSLKLESYFETSSCQSGQVQINLSVTSVLQRMFLCFSYAFPLVQSEYVDSVANRFMGIINRL